MEVVIGIQDPMTPNLKVVVEWVLLVDRRVAGEDHQGVQVVGVVRALQVLCLS